MVFLDFKGVFQILPPLPYIIACLGKGRPDTFKAGQFQLPGRGVSIFALIHPGKISNQKKRLVKAALSQPPAMEGNGQNNIDTGIQEKPLISPEEYIFKHPGQRQPGLVLKKRNSLLYDPFIQKRCPNLIDWGSCFQTGFTQMVRPAARIKQKPAPGAERGFKTSGPGGKAGRAETGGKGVRFHPCRINIGPAGQAL